MQTLKAVLKDVADEISAVQHGERIGDGHDRLMQRLDGVRSRIAEAIEADDARIEAEQKAKASSPL